MDELQRQLEDARREYSMNLVRNEVSRDLNPSPLKDSRANIRSARALGKLGGAITRGEMTIAVAISTAQLSPELGLDSGEVDWVVERLVDGFATTI